MTESIASLGIRVDSSQVATADTALDKLTASAGAAASAEKALATSSAQANAALGASVPKAAGLAAAVRQQSTTMGAAALSARQYAQSMRLLPAQITDVVTGLASGQSAFMVAIQQGGQLRDSFGGVGAALKAVRSILSPAIVGVAALATVVGALVKGFRDGQAESFNLYKSIVLSGNASGVTAGQLNQMAEAIDKVVGTRAQASEALAAAVATGRISAQSLQQVGEIAVRLQRTIGQPIEETVKEFAALGDKPVQAAEQLQKKYNFLTVSVYNQIRALEQQGRTAEAADLAQRTFAEQLDKRIQDLDKHLGVIPRAWRAIAGAAKEAWDAMLDIGREQTPEQQLEELLRQRAGRTRAPLRGGGPAVEDPRIAQLRAQIAANQRAATAAARTAKEFQDNLNQRAVDKAVTVADAQTAAARLQANLDAIKRTLQGSLQAFETADSILEAQRKAHLITETDYYAARRALLEADRVERVKALEAENRLLSAQQEQLRQAGGRAAGQADNQADAAKAALAVVPQIIALEEKRKANLAEMARISAEAAGKTVVSNLEEKKGLADIERGYQDARAAAESYLDTLARRQRLELEGFGAGNRQREINAARSDIEADFQRRRESLERDLRRGDITQEQFETYLRIEKDALDKSLQQNEHYFDALAEKQSDWRYGAIEAIRNYIDESKNAATQVADAISNGLDGATDALLNFVRTGKGGFRSLVDSILDDLLRIQLKRSIVSVLDSALGSVLGGIFGGGSPNASGAGGIGPPSYAVGTDYVPKDGLAYIHQGEAVIPRARNPAAGAKNAGSSININIRSEVNAGPGTNPAQLASFIDQRDQQLEARIYNNIARGRWAIQSG